MFWSFQTLCAYVVLGLLVVTAVSAFGWNHCAACTLEQCITNDTCLCALHEVLFFSFMLDILCCLLGLF